MGIGFVLFVWARFLGTVAVAGAIVLGASTSAWSAVGPRRHHRRRGDRAPFHGGDRRVGRLVHSRATRRSNR